MRANASRGFLFGVAVCVAHCCTAAEYQGFDVQVTSGPLTGQTFSGVLSYDPNNFVIEAFNQHPVTGVSFAFQGHTFTDADHISTIPISFTPTITNSGGAINGQPVLIYGLSDYFVADASLDIGFIFTGTTSVLGQYVNESRFTYGNQAQFGGFENLGEGLVTYYLVIPEPSALALYSVGTAIVFAQKLRRISRRFN